MTIGIEGYVRYDFKISLVPSRENPLVLMEPHCLYKAARLKTRVGWVQGQKASMILPHRRATIKEVGSIRQSNVVTASLKWRQK
jgi:hypothetical protein